MNIRERSHRTVAALLLVAMATGTLAPLAQADRGGNGKGRGRGRGHEARSERTWDRDRGDWGDRETRYRVTDRWRERSVARPRVIVRSEPRYVVRSEPRVIYRSEPRSSYRYRTYRSYPRYSSYGSYTVWRRSEFGPVLAGFIGGLFVGATLSNLPPAGFGYWDPYCHRGYASLSLYYSHCAHYHHARTIQVVEVPDDYGWDDHHYCDRCDEEYWGDEHECD